MFFQTKKSENRVNGNQIEIRFSKHKEPDLFEILWTP